MTPAREGEVAHRPLPGDPPATTYIGTHWCTDTTQPVPPACTPKAAQAAAGAGLGAFVCPSARGKRVSPPWGRLPSSALRLGRFPRARARCRRPSSGARPISSCHPGRATVSCDTSPARSRHVWGKLGLCARNLVHYSLARIIRSTGFAKQTIFLVCLPSRRRRVEALHSDLENLPELGRRHRARAPRRRHALAARNGADKGAKGGGGGWAAWECKRAAHGRGELRS